MSTLSTYKTILSRKLSTSSENYYDADARVQAINDGIRQFTDEYNPPELKKKANIAIAIDADDYYIGTFPADLSTHARVLRLWVKGTARKFVYVAPSDYYDMSGDIWTYDYNTANDDRRLYIDATDLSSLEMHYTKDPTTLINDADESGINSKADELICLYAAEKLFFEAKDIEAMSIIKDPKNMAVRAWEGKYGKTTRRLKSKYEEVSFHHRA